MDIRFLLISSATLLSACTTILGGPQRGDCLTGPITISGEFEGGRLSGCQQTGPSEFTLFIDPENTPINNSAWYAYEIKGAEQTPLTLTLQYDYGSHRYPPKIKYPNSDWTEASVTVDLSDDRKCARFEFTPEQDSVILSAQPILSTDAQYAWMQSIALKPFVSQSQIGQSLEGRPIYKLEEKDEETAPSQPYVFIAGRQHPPETTGALALMDFVEVVWGDTELASDFRERYNLIVIPMINPDGVYHGHWRHNLNGLDLNRDWDEFSQPETHAVKSELDRFDGEDALTLFLDFHSTRSNKLYTQMDDEPTDPPFFTRKWVEAARVKMPEGLDKYTREPSPARNSGTSKNYMYATYGVPAITYEVGDKTSREDIKTAARIFAEEMMTLLLEDDAP